MFLSKLNMVSKSTSFILFIILISIFHSNTISSLLKRIRGPKVPREDRFICQYIISLMPIIEHPFWHERVIKSDNSKHPSLQISDWLMEKCLRRFAHLLHEHQSNIQLTRSESRTRDTQRFSISVPKRNLIVVDLDESVIAARFVYFL